MLYLKAINNKVEKYPYTLGQLRKDNVNTTFPKQPNLETLSAFNMYPVTEVTPTLADGEKLVKVWTPELVSGHWILPHQAVAKTEEDLATESEVAWDNLREQRNKLLGETDFHALSDVNMPEEMTTYRQALRDLPETVDINNIIYPEKP
mgnify:CR=1 FL=1|jgi:hypothetical protein